MLLDRSVGNAYQVILIIELQNSWQHSPEFTVGSFNQDNLNRISIELNGGQQEPVCVAKSEDSSYEGS